MGKYKMYMMIMMMLLLIIIIIIIIWCGFVDRPTLPTFGEFYWDSSLFYSRRTLCVECNIFLEVEAAKTVFIHRS
jgi:amino acid transporter